MLDYPKPATHNLVFVSNTQPRKIEGTGGFWDGNLVAFIGEVVSQWVLVDTPETLEAKLQEIEATHKVSRGDITVAEL